MADNQRRNIFFVNVGGVTGCQFIPGPDKDSGKDTVCKQPQALVDMSKEWGELYNSQGLKEQCCAPSDPTTRRSICPAYKSLLEGGRNSTWARR